MARRGQQMEYANIHKPPHVAGYGTWGKMQRLYRREKSLKYFDKKTAVKAFVLFL
jgi:hypothetical protein